MNHCFSRRRQVKVDQIFVHENYASTDSKANDIALLRLGEILFPVLCKSFSLNISTSNWGSQRSNPTHPVQNIVLTFHNFSCMAVFSDERVDLSLFSPVCLPTKSSSFEGNVGHIYGGLDRCLIVKKHTFCRLGVNRTAKCSQTPGSSGNELSFEKQRIAGYLGFVCL